MLADWGLRLAETSVKLQARVLDPETLFFGKGYREVVNAKGDWGRAATSKAVLTGVAINKWAILFTDKNKAAVQAFVKIMIQQG